MYDRGSNVVINRLAAASGFAFFFCYSRWHSSFGKETTMAIESLLGLAFVAVVMLVVALYANKHRAEDQHHDDKMLSK